MISVIVPVLNEEEEIVSFLQKLQKYRNQGIELIVVDGGSQDATLNLARPLCDVVVTSTQGRANQMNAGASKANGEIFVFLHADTLMPEGFPQVINDGLANSRKVWGRFNVCLSGQFLSLRLIAFFMNLRSRLTGIATGDQAIFVSADVFWQLNGYDKIPLMEDIALSTQLNRITSPLCLKEQVITSSRRWEEFGIWRTVFLMWKLRFAYYIGADPNQLANKYD